MIFSALALPVILGYVASFNPQPIRPEKLKRGIAILENRLLSSTRLNTLSLNAKKKGKSKGSASPVKQGFGTVATPKGQKTTNSDYSDFPRLDPEVMETMVYSSPELFNEPGTLPDYVHEHLETIYGFENFNGQLQIQQIENQENEAPAMSFEDLLSKHSDDSLLPSSQTKRDSRSDFNDLIALATGGDTSSTSSPAAEDETSNQDWAKALNQLPPFSEFRVLHFDPLVLAIDDFFTPEECDRYIAMSTGGSSDKILQSRSPTVGKDKKSRSQRTSTTWYHFYDSVPELMAKAAKLLGLNTIQHWEEPQTVRYRRTEKFTWHLDALGPGENRPNKGGQRIATLLVYLTDIPAEDGGATMFRDLKTPGGERLAVVPKKGSALLFFPAAGGITDTPFDIRTLHCGQAVSEGAKHDKWIAQLWLCENKYVPTAPSPKNLHSNAFEEIAAYCAKAGQSG